MGGGEVIFVKENLKVVDLINVTTRSFESLFIEIFRTTRRAETVVEIIYRPPITDLSSFNNELENIIISLTITKSSLILVGDYNFNLLNNDTYENM